MQRTFGTLTLSTVPLVPRAPSAPRAYEVPEVQATAVVTPAVASPKVIMRDGKPVTTSRAVAEFFGKRHDNVLREIKALEIASELRASFFSDSTAPDGYGRPRRWWK